MMMMCTRRRWIGVSRCVARSWGVGAGVGAVLIGCFSGLSGCAAVAAPVAVQMAASGIGAANQGYAVWNGSRLRYVEAATFADMNEAIDEVIRVLHLQIVRETVGTDLASDQSEYNSDFDIYYGFPTGSRTQTRDYSARRGVVEPISWDDLEGTPMYRLIHVRTETKGLATIEVRRMTEAMTSVVVNAGPFGDRASVRMFVGRVNTWLIGEERIGATAGRESLYGYSDDEG